MVKRCRSEVWIFRHQGEYALRCERRSGHKGKHRAINGRDKHIDYVWKKGDPPSGPTAQIRDPDPKPFDVDELVRELNEERQMGCVSYTPGGLVIRPEPRRKLYRAHKAKCQ